MKERQVGVKRQERKSELYRVSSRQHRAFERKRNGYCLLYDRVRRTDTSSSVYASEWVCVCERERDKGIELKIDRCVSWWGSVRELVFPRTNFDEST